MNKDANRNMSDSANRNLNVAAFSMKCVQNVLNKNPENKDKYKTLVKKMSTLIQKNGYISTLAFCYSKSSIEHNEVLKNIIQWNCDNDKIKSLISNLNYNDKKHFSSKDIENYIAEIVKLEQKNYRIISKEMMILFGWIKRFADGMITE